MNSELLDTLIEKRIVTTGTHVEAEFLSMGMDGNSYTLKDIFTISNIKTKNNKKLIELIRKTENECVVNTYADSIHKIDGMEPERLAGIYNIKSDGTMKIVKLDADGNPVKRGRKPNKPRTCSIG